MLGHNGNAKKIININIRINNDIGQVEIYGKDHAHS